VWIEKVISKRAALDPNRFKRKEKGTYSKYEEDKIKKIAKRATSQPKQSKPKQEDEVVDLWAQDSGQKSNRRRRDERFLKSSMPQVKHLVLPKGGQSYNPKGKDHEALIDELVKQEAKEVAEK